MSEHDYLSTACWHGQRVQDPTDAVKYHQRCRRTCKFCFVGCACACHESLPPTAQ